MLKIVVTAVENRYGDLRYAREQNLFSKTTKENKKESRKKIKLCLNLRLKRVTCWMHNEIYLLWWWNKQHSLHCSLFHDVHIVKNTTNQTTNFSSNFCSLTHSLTLSLSLTSILFFYVQFFIFIKNCIS